jgi:heterotetrameric sarcosine oxidase gamma subunit
MSDEPQIEALSLTDVSQTGKLGVRGAGAGDLLQRVFGRFPEAGWGLEIQTYPQRANGASHPVNLKLLGLLTDEFLLLTPPGLGAGLARRLEAAQQPQAGYISLIDLSDGLAGFLLVGRDAPALLSKLCPLPLEAERFPDGCLAQSSLAKVPALLLRGDMEQTPAFEIYTGRSYGQYLQQALLEAGGEFGLRRLTQEAPAQPGDWRFTP